MKKQNKNENILEDLKVNIRIKLSGLWITVMILYLYNDFFALFSPGALEEVIQGYMGPFPVSQISLFSATILMAVPPLMIFLSLILKPKANRLTNIIVGVLYTAVGIGTVFGETWAYYITSCVVTISLTLLIVFYAWKWPKQKA